MVQDTTEKPLWRVIVSSLFPNDHRVRETFEGYYPDEGAACDAALRHEATINGGATIPTIVKAERIT